MEELGAGSELAPDEKNIHRNFRNALTCGIYLASTRNKLLIMVRIPIPNCLSLSFAADKTEEATFRKANDAAR